MGLLEEAQGAQLKRRRGTPCPVGVLSASLSEKDRNALEAALADVSLGAPAIAIAIKRVHDQEIKPLAIERHRKVLGGCKCEKPWLET